MGKKRAKRLHQVQKNYIEEESNPYQFSTDLYKKMDQHQKEYAKSIENTFATFCDAPSGTGKTTIAVLKAFEFLAKGRVQQIVYMRFVDDRYLKQGFLPGTIEEKEAKLFRPFFDALEEIGVDEKQYKQLKDMGHIILTTDTTLRGVNLKETFLITDETQNAREFGDLQLTYTRLHSQGLRGRMVSIGHSEQQDNKKVQRTAKMGYIPFQAFEYHMIKKPHLANSCRLVNDYRGEFSQWADQIKISLAEL